MAVVGIAVTDPFQAQRLPSCEGEKGNGPEISDPPSWKRVMIAAHQVIKKFMFFYNLTSKILKRVLKIIPEIVAETANQVNIAIAWIGLTSILKQIYTIKSFVKDIRNIKNSKELNDPEGIVWSSINLISRVPECASGLLSFGSSLQKLFGIAWISLFSIVTFPLTLGLLCYDFLASIVRTVMISYEFSKMPLPEAHPNLLNYLNEKVGITEEEAIKIRTEVNKKIAFQSEKRSDTPIYTARDEGEIPVVEEAKNLEAERQQKAEAKFEKRVKRLVRYKKLRMKRHTNKKIVRYMRRAKKYLEKNSQDMKTAESAVKDIRKLTARKLVFNAGELLFRMAELVMCVVSALFPFITPWIAIGISVANTVFSVSKKLYTSYGMGNGLKHPEFFDKSIKAS